MAGVNGKGTKLYVSDGGVFRESDRLAHLTEIGEIGGSTSEIDVTDLDSDGKEYVAGDTDYGTVSIAGNLVAEDETSAYSRLKGLFNSKRVVHWGVSHPIVTDANVKFKGYVSSLKFGARNTENLMTFTAEVRVSGALTDFEAPVGLVSDDIVENNEL